MDLKKKIIIAVICIVIVVAAGTAFYIDWQDANDVTFSRKR